MSSPEYFKVEYSINPWMVAGVEVDLDLAKKQWNNLKESINKNQPLLLPLVGYFEE